jgi:hypothetical protein
MAEAEAIKGRDMRLEVRRIRYGPSRDRHGDVGWLNFSAPHKHLFVVVTVTSSAHEFQHSGCGGFASRSMVVWR